jgi:uncharacterized protein (DUF4415 family)
MNESDSSSTSRTDWARVDTLADDEIDTSDAPLLGEAFFERATLRLPATRLVTIEVPADVAAWYADQGAEGERRMVAALRIYADAHRGG